jgi:hypothetical protein
MKLPAASGRGIKAELRRSHSNVEMIIDITRLRTD